jgi:hypothetical protein
VEATLFRQEDRARYVLNVIDYQQELPNIPIRDLRIRVRLDGRSVTAVASLPDGDPLPFVVEGDQVCVSLAELRDFAMIAISFVT